MSRNLLTAQDASSLNNNGKIIILESFSKEDKLHGYIKMRRIESLQKIFYQVGFNLIEIYNFYHPTNHPTKLYDSYRGKFCVKLLNKLCAYHIPYSENLLKAIAQMISNTDNGIVDSDSITKIMIFGR